MALAEANIYDPINSEIWIYLTLNSIKCINFN